MPTKLPQPTTTLTLRELNRATLARQMLLQRESLDVVSAVERLAGLQAQYSPSPYIALWTRLQDFQHDQLTNALHQRSIIKASLMRWTLHMVSACDYPFFSRAITEGRQASWRNIADRAGLDVDTLHERLIDFTSMPRTRDEIDEFLLTQLTHDPGLDTRSLWHSVSSRGWLVHRPPSGVWRYFGKNPYISAREWLGQIETPSLEASVLHLVRGYLAAYGPATRPDVLQWSGLRKVSQVDAALHELGDEVVSFKNESGKVVYDLTSAPRPGSDVPAPVRFLPKWDNMLLAYQQRERVLPDRYRKTVIKINGDVLPTFLVDGIVAGMWTSTREKDVSVLSLEPFEPIDPATRVALEEEGERLARFIEPDTTRCEVRFVAG